jgi:hypothetical protein
VRLAGRTAFAHESRVLDSPASQDATDCIRLRPEWSKSHFRRGDVYRHLGYWQQAEANFRFVPRAMHAPSGHWLAMRSCVKALRVVRDHGDLRKVANSKGLGLRA